MSEADILLYQVWRHMRGYNLLGDQRKIGDDVACARNWNELDLRVSRYVVAHLSHQTANPSNTEETGQKVVGSTPAARTNTELGWYCSKHGRTKGFRSYCIECAAESRHTTQPKTTHKDP